MTKFKVGDKVRVVKTIYTSAWSGYNVGDIFEVKGAYSGSVSTVDGPNLWHEEIEKVSDKPTKNQRISALETQVAELTAKVEALEKAQKPTVKLADTAEVFIGGKSIGKVDAVPVTFNEQRKAIIAEATAFEGTLPRTDSGRYLDCGKYDCTVEYIVNSKKRTVVALLKGMTSGIIRYKGVAKCAPDDVFNADIGKAIALGRALGLDVSRFEQAVKPTVAIGQLIEHKDRDRAVYRVNTLQGNLTITDIGWNNASAYGGNLVEDTYWYDITDDTEAQY